MVRIALSGAGGQIGRSLRPRLLAAGHRLRSGAGFDALEPLSAEETIAAGDLRDPEAVDRLLSGSEVLVHMAGTSVERPLPEVIENNLVALHAVYEGARRHGLRRVVFASSNHAFGMHPVEARLGAEAPFRPDGFYGLSKAWGEAMGRMYWDKHGIEGVALRIGTAQPRPTEPRHLATWLGLDDLAELVLRAVTAAVPGYLAVWGVSDNGASYWDNSGAAAIGYRPRQSADAFAREILAGADPRDPVARRFQGGSFAAMDYTPETERPDRSSGGDPAREGAVPKPDRPADPDPLTG
ncbi:NAD-dependent epimerase/dehydratase [Methylobacterium sp. 4-46]|uniref:NAD-dependent epimerase/dehydratase family protein n=1 Tax=unclassified Methylobacterium TaxID=2615210 RepID=UPI000152CD60|nr:MULTISPECIES: NAD(P)-dependent oxidoreductase [Methylobacterium]ACA15173.1 NAD-dependent epimerase/dehydratase [Methylobacterium sp. 4-46]WFT80906.1 NAD(P)-dependent oxidoreductase [Methylobacterium nodulans]